MSLELLVTLLVVVVGLGTTAALYVWDRARRARSAPHQVQRERWPGRLPASDHGGHLGSFNRPERPVS